MYTCVYTHICTHMYTHTNICVHSYRHTHRHTHTYTHIHTLVNVSILSGQAELLPGVGVCINIPPPRLLFKATPISEFHLCSLCERHHTFQKGEEKALRPCTLYPPCILALQPVTRLDCHSKHSLLKNTSIHWDEEGSFWLCLQGQSAVFIFRLSS